MCREFKSFSFDDAEQSVKDVSEKIVSSFKEAIDSLNKLNKN